MKASINRSKVRLAETASCRSLDMASACTPLARNVASRCFAVVTGSTPCAERDQVGRRPDAVAERRRQR